LLKLGYGRNKFLSYCLTSFLSVPNVLSKFMSSRTRSWLYCSVVVRIQNKFQVHGSVHR